MSSDASRKRGEAGLQTRLQFIAILSLVICLGFFTLLAIVPFDLGLPKPHIVSSDKLQHLVSFFLLTLLCAIALARTALIVLIPALTLFGFAIEYIQPLFERTLDTSDALANLAGIGAAWLALGAARLRSSLKTGTDNL